MTIAAEKKDEKVEKRRGLGPRVVVPSGESGPGQSGSAGGETTVPRFARDDKDAARDDRGLGAAAPHTSPGVATQEGGAAQNEVISIHAQAISASSVVDL